ncbi:hypothetical protein OROHE_026061 [Orobanche hederae]
MAPQLVDFDRIALIPPSLTPLCSCRSRANLRRPELGADSNFHKLRFKLEVSANGARRQFRAPGGVLLKHRGRVMSAIARAEEPERVDDSEITNELYEFLIIPGCDKILSLDEAKRGNRLSAEGSIDSEHGQKTNQLRKRIIFGLGIGLSVGGVVLAGGWVFTVALAAAVFVGSREYFELVRSLGIASGMTPPPRYVSRACSAICGLMPLLTL